MNTTPRVKIEIPVPPSKWLGMVADAARMTKEQLICSLFARMAQEVVEMTKHPRPKHELTSHSKVLYQRGSVFHS